MKVFLIASALISVGAIAAAQTDHSGHKHGMDHSMETPAPADATAVLTEPGQGAFAALSEVVRVLEADPETDWTQVDLDGLRAHLVDMDRLVSYAQVETTRLPEGLSAFATGDTETLGSLRRMVPAHAAQLAMDDRWQVEATDHGDGVELKVTSSDPQVAARIKGLGFFGLMASQDHHREHHLMMAIGEEAHAH
ncbi:hypothetical protein [Donghicola sp. XS_ASV15]|uniref:hypothetical protein n=1 Tax=Donghicola sp. XS_ASV15 TaxID=3241295 RepID=UPI003516B68A